VLRSLISPEQSAFVPGRPISDNILTNQEVAHSFDQRNFNGRFVLAKLDIERAYDGMRWEVINRVLGCFSFEAKFKKWINGCMRNPVSAMLVNGEPSNWFLSTMGLRQGCPLLSPYQFMLGSEMLSRLVSRHERAGLIKGFRPTMKAHSTSIMSQSNKDYEKK